MKKIVAILTIAFILSGCGNEGILVFSGSEENWEVIYNVNVMNENREETYGTIKYVGEEPAPKTASYKIGTVMGTTEVQDTDVKNGVINVSNNFCDGCAVTRKDEKIAVEINWNGQSEDINLKNDK